MKTNDLRIGNFISDANASDSFFARVKKLDYSRCFYGQFHSAYSDLKPIAISEEWLIKFGFKMIRTNKDSGYKELGLIKKRFHIMFSIECNCNPECFVENIGIDIIYVHQLQNLYFALTGEELAVL